MVERAVLCQRAPRNASYALIGKQPEHLALLLALHQVVQILHGHELGPAVQLGDVLHLGELPGPHRRGTEVAGLASLDDIVEGFHRFLDWRDRIETMYLIEVDVVGAEANKRGVDLLQNRFAG